MSFLTKEQIDEEERITKESIATNTMCCADCGICNHDLDSIHRKRISNMREKLDELKKRNEKT
ncbi:MAG: hypothetical protein V3U54_08530 [Thermodesulfobacteriota bacterium]